MRDRFTLYARGGEGGSGCSSVRRSRADRYGKPDGTILILLPIDN
jgi:GTP-binding protein